MTTTTAMDESLDIGFMRRALDEARAAGERGEVPVGAVLVHAGEVLAAAGNGAVRGDDPTAHAEIAALRAGAARTGNYRLPGTTLYVTLEPCCMCVGAMIHARIERLVFGARDPKSGAAGSVFDLAGAPAHNHHMDVTGGVLAEDCGAVLQSFFQARRRQESASREG